MRKWIIRILKIVGVLLLLLVLGISGLLYYMQASEGSLRRAVSGSTKVVVRSGGLCHRAPSREKVLFKIEDKAAIQELISNIHLVSMGGIGQCMCCGNPTFEFYKDSKLIASVGFHHRRNLRWDRWFSDGELTPESSKYLVSLLEKNGLTQDDFR